MSDNFIETTSFVYTAGTVTLDSVLPSDMIGTRVPATIHIRNASGTPIPNVRVAVRPASATVYTPTGLLILASDTPATFTTDATGTGTVLLYPTSTLEGHPPYVVTVAGLGEQIGFVQADGGSDIVVSMTPLTPRGLVGATPTTIGPGTNSSVHHTSPDTLQEWMENIQYRLDHP